MVTRAVELSDSGFFAKPEARVELASSGVLIGRRRLDDERAGVCFPALLEVGFDVRHHRSTDAVPLMRWVDGDEVQVPHAVGERFGSELGGADDDTLGRLGDEPPMTFEAAVQRAGDHFVEEPGVFDTEHLGGDGDLLDSIEIDGDSGSNDRGGHGRRCQSTSFMAERYRRHGDPSAARSRPCGARCTVIGMHLDLVSVIVEEYDEAIEFYTEVLGFELTEDSPALTTVGGREKRWVVVRPPGDTAATGLLLAQADGDHQTDAIGQQFAGRVGLFLRVDDFEASYARMQRLGVDFLEEPRHETYGSVVVFRDVAGNSWDLLGPAPTQ